MARPRAGREWRFLCGHKVLAHLRWSRLLCLTGWSCEESNPMGARSGQGPSSLLPGLLGGMVLLFQAGRQTPVPSPPPLLSPLQAL